MEYENCGGYIKLSEKVETVEKKSDRNCSAVKEVSGRVDNKVSIKHFLVIIAIAAGIVFTPALFNFNVNSGQDRDIQDVKDNVAVIEKKDGIDTYKLNQLLNKMDRSLMQSDTIIKQLDRNDRRIEALERKSGSG